MSTPLIGITVLSIYEQRGQRVALPSRMARCTPDMKKAIMSLCKDVEKAGGKLYLSDLFRSYDMQLQAHLDWKTGKKKAYSPPPGGSMHEAGRAFDLDLKSLRIPLKDFWDVAAPHGVVPIIDTPDPKKSEAWHFERRGSHSGVYDYYKAGKGKNFSSPARAAAASAILSVGQPVDVFEGKSEAAYIQSALIRLDKEIGNMDGDIGPKTRKALSALGIVNAPLPEIVLAVDRLLQEKFPHEFYDSTPLDVDNL